MMFPRTTPIVSLNALQLNRRGGTVNKRAAHRHAMSSVARHRRDLGTGKRHPRRRASYRTAVPAIDEDGFGCANPVNVTLAVAHAELMPLAWRGAQSVTSCWQTRRRRLLVSNCLTKKGLGGVKIVGECRWPLAGRISMAPRDFLIRQRWIIERGQR